MQGAESSLIFLVVMIAIFYFMLVRPQKKRQTEHVKLIQSIGQGDEVLMRGGEYGRISAVRDDSLDVELSPGHVVKYAKSAVFQVLTPEDENAPPAGA